MRKRLLLLLLLLAGVPFLVVISGLPAPTAADQVRPADLAPPSATQPLDSAQSCDKRDVTPAASCGANFCTQAQKTQCAQSCRRHPFVGLECCFDTCTSFCNCGSVPTGC
jgi:hypothetical protein